MKKNFVKKLALGLALVMAASSIQFPAPATASAAVTTVTPSFADAKAVVKTGKTKAYKINNATGWKIKKVTCKDGTVASVVTKKAKVKITGVKAGETVIKAVLKNTTTKEKAKLKLPVTVVSTVVTKTAMKYFATADSAVNKYSVAQIFEKMDAGEEMVIIDVRDAADYVTEHLKGAINIPYFEIGDKIEHIPDDVPVYVHCYSGQTASQMVSILNAAGKKAGNIQGGWNSISTAEGFADHAETTVNALPKAKYAVAPEMKEAIVAYCAEASANQFKKFNISVDQVKALVEAGDSTYTIVDVRDAETYAKGHIEGANINIPFGNGMQKSFNKIPKDKPVIVCCFSGQTASQTVGILRLLGYEAYNMSGGMTNGWLKNELPTTTAYVARNYEELVVGVKGTAALIELSDNFSTKGEETSWVVVKRPVVLDGKNVPIDFGFELLAGGITFKNFNISTTEWGKGVSEGGKPDANGVMAGGDCLGIKVHNTSSTPVIVENNTIYHDVYNHQNAAIYLADGTNAHILNNNIKIEDKANTTRTRNGIFIGAGVSGKIVGNNIDSQKTAMPMSPLGLTANLDAMKEAVVMPTVEIKNNICESAYVTSMYINGELFGEDGLIKADDTDFGAREALEDFLVALAENNTFKNKPNSLGVGENMYVASRLDLIYKGVSMKEASAYFEVVDGKLVARPAANAPTVVTQAANNYFATAPENVNKYSPAEIFAKMDAGEKMVIVDVRDAVDYEKEHLKGAINIPYFEIGDKLERIPDDVPVYVNCYSGQTASQMVALLNVAGKTAGNIQGGWNAISTAEGFADHAETTKNALPKAKYAVDPEIKEAIVAYCDEAAANEFKKFNISVDKVYELVQAGDTTYTIVDVRDAATYAAGHIEGANINIPFGIGMQENFHKIPKDKPVIVCCFSGQTASQTVGILRLLGYEAYNMSGGMTNGWLAKELPTVK